VLYFHEGSGGTFQVYDLEKKAKIFEKHVFMNASIHGIKVTLRFLTVKVSQLVTDTN